MKRSHERGSKTLHQKNELSKVSKKWPCWMKSSYKVLPWRAEIISEGALLSQDHLGFFQSSDRPLYSKSMEMVLLLADTLVLQLTNFLIKYSNYNTVMCIFVPILSLLQDP